MLIQLRGTLALCVKCNLHDNNHNNNNNVIKLKISSFFFYFLKNISTRPNGMQNSDKKNVSKNRER